MHFLQSALETLLNSLGSKGSKGSSKRPCEHTGLAGADPAAASLEALLDGAEPSALDTLFDQQPSTTKRRKIAAQLEVPAASSALEMQRALRDAVGSWSSSSSQLESFCASSSEGESGSESSPGLCACLLAGGSSDLRGAFFANLQSTTALAALVATEQLHSDAQRKATLQRPFCHDSPSDNLKATLGAMYCLLRRGKWGAHELTPELLVTALWLVQAWDEQLWQFASYSAQAFAKRDPAAKGEHAPLHRAMLVLQLEVLIRCDWRCRLPAYELRSAIQELSECPEFEPTVTYVLSEAHRAKTGFIQGQPTYTYSYAAALSVAATPASLSSAVSQRRCVPGHPSKYATPGLTLAEEARAVTRTMARARLSEH